MIRALVLAAVIVVLMGQAVGNGNNLGVTHIEAVTAANASLTCTLTSLCSVGSITFKAPFPDTSYHCALSPVAATAAVSFLPTMSAKTTTGITVNALATVALVSQSVAVEGVCAE